MFTRYLRGKRRFSFSVHSVMADCRVVLDADRDTTLVTCMLSNIHCMHQHQKLDLVGSCDVISQHLRLPKQPNSPCICSGLDAANCSNRRRNAWDQRGRQNRHGGVNHGCPATADRARASARDFYSPSCRVFDAYKAALVAEAAFSVSPYGLSLCCYVDSKPFMATKLPRYVDTVIIGA
jgi:hypothetical protein